jgi:nucleoid DNA-binding protein
VNKADLIDTVAGDLEISKAQAERSVNAVLENIKKGVKNEKLVQLIGFGTFTFKERKARPGRNPQTGETITIQASKSVAFRPGKQFKDML